MQAVWHAVDKDGSGLLDQSELAAVFVQVCDSSACSNNCCSPCDSDLIRNEQILETQAQWHATRCVFADGPKSIGGAGCENLQEAGQGIPHAWRPVDPQTKLSDAFHDSYGICLPQVLRGNVFDKQEHTSSVLHTRGSCRMGLARLTLASLRVGGPARRRRPRRVLRGLRLLVEC